MAGSLEDVVASLFWDRDKPPPVDSDVALRRVMDLGDWDAILLLESAFPRQRLERVLRDAPAGGLSKRSHRFWQVRLGQRELPEPERLPGTEHHELPFGYTG